MLDFPKKYFVGIILRTPNKVTSCGEKHIRQIIIQSIL